MSNRWANIFGAVLVLGLFGGDFFVKDFGLGFAWAWFLWAWACVGVAAFVAWLFTSKRG